MRHSEHHVLFHFAYSSDVLFAIILTTFLTLFLLTIHIPFRHRSGRLSGPHSDAVSNIIPDVIFDDIPDVIVDVIPNDVIPDVISYVASDVIHDSFQF